ncbi:phosphatidylglycerophosphatase and protein-tyrosine phosphatase 1 isoform X2 [Erythrolamprus reginae]|uniref:phosphatidylglycerophosphatase and protein-tyrosine phosphatase 1 isoform X2 n=1 Tax=Erythrolamprus reginae TaxID=121349 RepID=UPI00396CF5DE
MNALGWFPEPRKGARFQFSSGGWCCLDARPRRRVMSFPKDTSQQPRPPKPDLSMVISAALGPGVARLFYYPTLLYTLVRAQLPGSRRPWFSRIDRAVVLGALPLRGRCRQEWEEMGVEQMRLSTVDLTGIPSLENLQKGVKFVLKHRECGNSVYVHCKAGRSRSATMVAAYLIQVHHWTPQEAIEVIAKIRPHIIVRRKQMDLLEDFHKTVTDENLAESQKKPTDTKHQLPQNQQRDRNSLKI